MLEILQFPFMQRALVAGVLLAVLLALLGVFVVLRRMAFFADGIAHASLAGIAIGIVASVSPLAIALAVAAVGALIIYWLERSEYASADTVIGILLTSGMALGVVLLSFQPGYQPELISFLFGNILAIKSAELALVLGVGLAVAMFILTNLRGLVLFSLDRDTAHVSGVKTGRIHLALYVLLSLAVVLGIKVLGVILVSALLIIPVAASKLVARSFKQLIVGSIILAEVTVIAGIGISYYQDLPTGPTIVLVGTALFGITALFRSVLQYKT